MNSTWIDLQGNERTSKKNERVIFNSDLKLAEVIVNIESLVLTEKENIDEIIRVFNRFGFVIIQLPYSLKESPSQNLLALKQHFGNVVRHNYSNKEGITIIHDNPDREGELFKSQNNSAHPLHTGGTYLKKPSQVVAIYCVNPAKRGGITQIMSGKLIYQYIQQHNPEGLKQLCRSNAVIFGRGEEQSKKPIFALGKDGRRQICFRYDNTAKITIHPDAQEAFGQICSFRENRKNRIEFKLDSNQVYITDNTAVLHGRTSYPKETSRCMLRLNMDGNSNRLILGF